MRKRTRRARLSGSSQRPIEETGRTLKDRSGPRAVRRSPKVLNRPSRVLDGRCRDVRRVALRACEHPPASLCRLVVTSSSNANWLMEYPPSARVNPSVKSLASQVYAMHVSGA